MNIDLNAFRQYSNVNFESKTNLVLNQDGNGLTTTKARGGVNMLAGLLNIGTRARYGRETLEALKGALISEFKAQTNLSDQECMDSVNAAFKEAFNMDFAKAKSKALKLNSQMVRKVLDAADGQMKAHMAPVDTESPKSLKIDTLYANSRYTNSSGQKILPKGYGKEQYGFKFTTFTESLLPKIKADLNTVVLTKSSADFIIGKLESYIDQTELMLDGEGKSDVVNEYAEKLPDLGELKNDIIARLQAKIAELKKIQ